MYLGEFSIGAALWELTHPAQVQRDLRITGNGPVPSQPAIVAASAWNLLNPANAPDLIVDAWGNVGRSVDTIDETARAVAAQASRTTQWAGLALLAAGAAYVAMRSKRRG